MRREQGKYRSNEIRNQVINKINNWNHIIKLTNDVTRH